MNKSTMSTVAVALLTIMACTNAMDLEWNGPGATSPDKPGAWTCQGIPAGCPKSPSGAADTDFKETILGKEAATTPFTMVIGESTPMVMGTKITLHEGKIVLGTGAGGTAVIRMAGSDKGMTAHYTPGSGMGKDKRGGPYDVMCNINWKHPEATPGSDTRVPTGAPCKDDAISWNPTNANGGMVYAANYPAPDGTFPMFSVASSSFSGAGDVCDAAMIDMGMCNGDTNSDFVAGSTQAGSCETTCPPMVEFTEHDSGEKWALQQFHDEWNPTTSEWEKNYKVVRADGFVVPQKVVLDLTVGADGEEMVTFDLVSDASTLLNNGKTHKYSGSVSSGALERLTTTTVPPTSVAPATRLPTGPVDPVGDPKDRALLLAVSEKEAAKERACVVPESDGCILATAALEAAKENLKIGFARDAGLIRAVNSAKLNERRDCVVPKSDACATAKAELRVAEAELQASTDAKKDSSGEEDDSEEGSMVPMIAGAAGGALVILVIVIIVCKKGKDGEVDRGIISFENPMYDNPGGEDNGIPEPNADLYDEPAFADAGDDEAGYADLPAADGYAELPAAEGANSPGGYMDVDAPAADGEDLYNELGDGFDAGDDATYEDVGAVVGGINEAHTDGFGNDDDDENGGYLDVEDTPDNTGFDDQADE